MRQNLSSDNNPGVPLVVIDLEPSRIRGSRNAFGPMLHLSLQVLFEQDKHQPLLFEGMLCWPDEPIGLMIPLQTVGRGTAALNIPVSDQQIASLEQRRAGKKLRFELEIHAIGTPDEPGEIGRYSCNPSISLDVPRDTWAEVLNAIGVGSVRIIELPIAPSADESLEAAALQLTAGASLFSSGCYGEAIVEARTCLERMTESIGSRVGLPRGEKPFSPFVDELWAKLKDRSHRGDPLALIGNLIKTAFGWASDPAHKGFHVSKRDDALFALNLCIALYSFIATATGWEILDDGSTSDSHL